MRACGDINGKVVPSNDRNLSEAAKFVFTAQLQSRSTMKLFIALPF